MNALLVRVGADQSAAGGSWNGLVDSRSGRFAYVPIPEAREVRAGLEKPYRSIEPALDGFGRDLPAHLQGRGMHLDPDFEHLTYGDPATTLRHYVRLTTAARAKAVAGLDEVTRTALEAAQREHAAPAPDNVVALSGRRRQTR